MRFLRDDIVDSDILDVFRMREGSSRIYNAKFGHTEKYLSLEERYDMALSNAISSFNRNDPVKFINDIISELKK